MSQRPACTMCGGSRKGKNMNSQEDRTFRSLLHQVIFFNLVTGRSRGFTHEQFRSLLHQVIFFNGHGIRRKYLPQSFDPFFIRSSSSTRNSLVNRAVDGRFRSLLHQVIFFNHHSTSTVLEHSGVSIPSSSGHLLQQSDSQ